LARQAPDPAPVRPLAPAPEAWPVVPEPAGQASVLQLPPPPQAQPTAESFSSVWLLEISGSIFSGKSYPQPLRSNCIPLGPLLFRILLWNAGLPGRAGRADPRLSVETADPFSRLAGL